jgi:predicted metalloprotease
MRWTPCKTLLGTSIKIDKCKGKSQAEANKLSVALELQADFYAGVWTHYNQKNNFLEEGDIDEALSAAHAVGVMQFRLKFKDILFQNPLHGTSAQRKHGLWAINPETSIKAILLQK